ncbi:MAG: hypothetical protein ACJ0TD_00175 [Arenicellales bacterium]
MTSSVMGQDITAIVTAGCPASRNSVDLLLGVGSKFSRSGVTDVGDPNDECDVLACQGMVAVNRDLCIIDPDNPEMHRLAAFVFGVEFGAHMAQFLRRIFDAVRKGQAGVMRGPNASWALSSTSAESPALKPSNAEVT